MFLVEKVEFRKSCVIMQLQFVWILFSESMTANRCKTWNQSVNRQWGAKHSPKAKQDFNIRSLRNSDLRYRTDIKSDRWIRIRWPPEIGIWIKNRNHKNHNFPNFQFFEKVQMANGTIVNISEFKNFRGWTEALTSLHLGKQPHRWKRSTCIPNFQLNCCRTS